jgi:hypothetical protein
MSWLSELFSGGGGEDPLAIRQREEQQRRDDLARQQAQADAEARDRAAQLDLQNRQYNDQMAFLTKSMTPTDLDTEYQNQQLQDLKTQSARNAARSAATGQINSVFTPEFERSYVPDTFDDSYINEAYTGERGKVDEYINNLLKRGVITESGATGARADADEQGARVRTQLGDVGSALLDAQRGKLTDVANRGRDVASTIDVGQTFDPSVYSNEIAQLGTDFGTSFGDKFKSGIPSDLFDLSEIQQKGGAAQGAQNLAFNPSAVAGTDTTDDQTDLTKPQTKRPVSVF